MKNQDEAPNADRFSAPYFFYSYDETGKLRFVSDSINLVLGFSSNEAMGRPFQDFFVQDHELNENSVERHTHRFSHTGIQNDLRAVQNRDRQLRIISTQTIGVIERESGKIIRCQGLAADITETFQLEERLHRRRQEIEKLLGELEPREVEVLNFIMAGKLNKQMASELSVATRTIESIRSRLMQKLNANHVAELVSLESERRLLTTILDTPHHSAYRPHFNTVFRKARL